MEWRLPCLLTARGVCFSHATMDLSNLVLVSCSDCFHLPHHLPHRLARRSHPPSSGPVSQASQILIDTISCLCWWRALSAPRSISVCFVSVDALSFTAVSYLQTVLMTSCYLVSQRFLIASWLLISTQSLPWSHLPTWCQLDLSQSCYYLNLGWWPQTIATSPRGVSLAAARPTLYVNWGSWSSQCHLWLLTGQASLFSILVSPVSWWTCVQIACRYFRALVRRCWCWESRVRQMSQHAHATGRELDRDGKVLLSFFLWRTCQDRWSIAAICWACTWQSHVLYLFPTIELDRIFPESPSLNQVLPATLRSISTPDSSTSS